MVIRRLGGGRLGNCVGEVGWVCQREKEKEKEVFQLVGDGEHKNQCMLTCHRHQSRLALLPVAELHHLYRQTSSRELGAVVVVRGREERQNERTTVMHDVPCYFF